MVSIDSFPCRSWPSTTSLISDSQRLLDVSSPHVECETDIIGSFDSEDSSTGYQGLIDNCACSPESSGQAGGDVQTRESGTESNEESVKGTKVRSNPTLKNELRNKIQDRRRSEGIGEMTVQFDPPKSYQLSAEEKRRCELRRQRNRDSANRSRLKRQFKLNYLEKEVEELCKLNKELSSQVEVLKKVKTTLEKTIQSHDCRKANFVAAPGQSHGFSSSASSSTSDEDQNCLSDKSDGYSRGRLAFKKLPAEIQNRLVKIYQRRGEQALPKFSALEQPTSSGC